MLNYSSTGNEAKRITETEYKERAQRRKFSKAYKERILAEADRVKGQGEIGALLRREGLYSSHLTTWRRQAMSGELGGSVANKRGRKAKASEAAEVQAENRQLRQQLEQAEAIISAQKKLSQFLEQMLGGPRDVT